MQKLHYTQKNFFINRRIKEITKLKINIEVKGMYNLKFSFSMRTSPGRFPNQLSHLNSLFSIIKNTIPIIIKTPPIIKNILLISLISIYFNDKKK